MTGFEPGSSVVRSEATTLPTASYCQFLTICCGFPRYNLYRRRHVKVYLRMFSFKRKRRNN